MLRDQNERDGRTTFFAVRIGSSRQRECRWRSPTTGPDRIAFGSIQDDVRGQIINLALELPELSLRELAMRFTDQQKHFVSEASVYRLLKAHDLITNPAYVVIIVFQWANIERSFQLLKRQTTSSAWYHRFRLSSSFGIGSLNSALDARQYEPISLIVDHG